MLRNLIVGAAALFIIAGCADQQAQLIEQGNNEADQVERECDVLLRDARINTIRQKFPPRFSGDDIGLRHLADETYISEAERKELLIYDELMRRCKAKWVDYAQNTQQIT